MRRKFGCLGWLVCLLAACDNPPPPPAAGSAPRPVVSAPTEAGPPSAVASAVVPIRKRKDPASCPKEGPVGFDDPTLEAAIRRQLQKPTGPLARAELRKVKTLDLSQQARADELDPCVFSQLTGLKGLYLPASDIDDLSPLRAAV